jgi:predicted nuclease of predicted toxin-antitoxin system
MPHGLLKNGKSTSSTHETAGRLSPRWVDQFGAAHWSSVGSPHALDQEITAYAAKHDYVVLTNDLDFGAILAVTHGEKPSVVQIRSENLSPDIIGVQAINALRQLADQLAMTCNHAAGSSRLARRTQPSCCKTRSSALTRIWPQAAAYYRRHPRFFGRTSS